MPVPLDARALWFFSAATIPANWLRDTNFDDHFLQGVSGDSRTSGGAASHSHTTIHTHLGNAHTHTFSGNSLTANYSNKRMDFSGLSVPGATHGHNSAPTNPITITYQNDTTPTSSVAAKPPYITAIIIKPFNNIQDIPQNAVVFSDSAKPAGFTYCDGGQEAEGNQTPDLRDKFILGADTGDDGGGAGGSTTHSQTQADHTHQDDEHHHGTALCGTFSGVTRKVRAAVTSDVYPSRHHNVALQANTLSDLSTDGTTVDDATFEPAYIKLIAMMRYLSADTPINTILPYIGTEASVLDLADWIQCDGTNGTPDLTSSQIKCTIVVGDVGNTGGNNNHLHAVQSHGHTHASTHTHAGPSFDEDIEEEATELGEPYVQVVSTTKSHSHVWTASDTLATIQDKAFNTSLSDGRYNYRTLIFIKRVSITKPLKDIIQNTGVIPFARY